MVVVAGVDFDDPQTTEHVAARIDQRTLLARMGRNRPLPPAKLRSVIAEVARSSGSESVTLDLPDRGRVAIVEAKDIQDRFDEWVENHSRDQLRVDLRFRPSSMRARDVRRALGATVDGPFGSVVSAVLPTVLTIAEVFARTPNAKFKLISSTPLRPAQHASEITALLGELTLDPPTSALEIGTSRGGTTYLLLRHAASDATVATVDLDPKNSKVLRRLRGSHQTLHIVEGSSRDADVSSRIGSFFPSGLDLLLIDGDHSYEGARSDYETYTPWVRPGGRVVLHDIWQDNSQRLGVDTGGWSGGVPQLWKELKHVHADTKEYVMDPRQDGLGLGVIYVPRR
jgi:predicted O-methyltransferase YrrM